MLKYVSKYILKAKDLKMTGIQHLTRSVAGFLSFQLIFTVNSAHKNYKLYLPYSKTTLHLQNNFLHMVITMSHHSGYEARKTESKFRKT